MIPKMIRVFFAIKPPQETLEQIEDATKVLKKSIPNAIKWVSSNTIHITLKFIGSFNPNHNKSIEGDLNKVLLNYGSLIFSIGKIGVFPNLKKPKIICLRVDENSQMNYFVKVINSITSDLGYENEKRAFYPHLTIGRVKNSFPYSERHRIGQKTVNYQVPHIDKVEVNKLNLIKSTLTQKGPNYTILYEIDL